MLKRLRKPRSLVKENREIVSAFKAGDLGQAIVIADRHIRDNGNDPLLLFTRGSVRMAQNRGEDAIRDFSLAIDNAGDNLTARVDALLSRGACFKLAGNHRLAEKDTDKALDLLRANEKVLGPSRLATVLMNRGQLFDAMSLPKEAIEAYGELIKMPRSPVQAELLPVALNNRGLALMRLDDPRSLALAADDFNAALSLAPQTAVFHHNFALCLQAQGDRAGAAREVRLAAKFDPKFVPPRSAHDDDDASYDGGAPKKAHSEAVDAPLLAKKKTKKKGGSKRASVNDNDQVTPTSSEEE